MNIRFDPTTDAQLLVAAGYVHEFVFASWEDDGDCENGPHLSGHPDMDVFTLDRGNGADHEIVVIDEEIVSSEFVPHGY